MRSNKNIRNLAQLQQELAFLKLSYEQKGSQIKVDTKTYIANFSIFNLIKKHATPSALLKFDDKTNIVGKLMSTILPLIINKTLFRNAGFITKILTGLGANKLGQSLDAQSLSGLFNRVKSLFTKKEKPENSQKLEFADYGIPPDSETF